MKTIKQEDEFGCVIACLAMMTGKTYKQVRDEVARYWDCFRKDALFDGLNGFDKGILLYGMGFKSRCFNVSRSRPRKSIIHLLKGEKALIGVPSLNYKGKFHCLYWDGKKIHDPSTKKTYTTKLALEKFVDVTFTYKLVKSSLRGIDGGL